MLMHDFGKPHCITTDEKGINHFYGHPEKSEEIARGIMHRLKFDNDTLRKVCILIRCHNNTLYRLLSF